MDHKATKIRLISLTSRGVVNDVKEYPLEKALRANGQLTTAVHEFISLGITLGLHVRIEQI